MTDHDGDGVVGPEYLEWMDWYDDYYDKPYKEDYWNTEVVPKEWGWTDEYWWYDEKYDYDYGYVAATGNTHRDSPSSTKPL